MPATTAFIDGQEILNRLIPESRYPGPRKAKEKLKCKIPRVSQKAQKHLIAQPPVLNYSSLTLTNMKSTAGPDPEEDNPKLVVKFPFYQRF